MRYEHREICDFLARRFPDGHGIRRGRRLEPHREENNLALRIRTGELQGIER
jgi:hypothetical protein